MRAHTEGRLWMLCAPPPQASLLTLSDRTPLSRIQDEMALPPREQLWSMDPWMLNENVPICLRTHSKNQVKKKAHPENSRGKPNVHIKDLKMWFMLKWKDTNSQVIQHVGHVAAVIEGVSVGLFSLLHLALALQDVSKVAPCWQVTIGKLSHTEWTLVATFWNAFRSKYEEIPVAGIHFHRVYFILKSEIN